MSEQICICGKPIWGEGCDINTGQRFWSHMDDGKERHEDGTWVNPKPKGEDLDVVQGFEEWHSRTPITSADPREVDWARFHRKLAWNAAKAESAALRAELASLSSRCESLQGELAQQREITGEWQEVYRGVVLHSREIEADLARERELHRWRDVNQELPPMNIACSWNDPHHKGGFTTSELVETWHPKASADRTTLQQQRKFQRRISYITKGKDNWVHDDLTHWRPCIEPPALLEPKSESAPKPDTEGGEDHE